jgi:hypothetical protein
MDYWHMHLHELEDVLSPFKETGKDEAFGESVEHLEEMKFSPADKLKVARIIAVSLGDTNADEKSGAESMVNNALRKIKNKTLSKEAWKILANMLEVAENAGIKYDEKILGNKIEKFEESKIGHTIASTHPQKDYIRKMKIKHHLGEEETEELTDLQINELVDSITEDDYLEVYEDHEFNIEDEDTGEILEDIQEEVIMEVLSRAERMRAKTRFKRTEAKRERKTKIALKMRSSNKVINNRARRLAINLMKQRIAKKPASQMSVAEKERVERIIAKRKSTLNRVAMKLVPRIKKIESNRLSGKHTKTSAPSVAM